MLYVYLLYSQKDHKMYTGCTNNLKRRFQEHNNGKVKSTKSRTPFKLLHYKAFINKKYAFARERWLKTGYGRNHIGKLLSETIKSLGE